MMRRFVIAALSCAVLATARPASADLIDLQNGMIYDTVQNLTWLQDVMHARTSGYSATGRMTYEEGQEWTAGLSFGGFEDWRMPALITEPRPADRLCNCAGDSEVSRLMEQLSWHWNQEPINTYVAGSAGPFLNAILLYPVSPTHRWTWAFDVDFTDGAGTGAAWAVRSGNPLARVPEPSALLLMLLGGLGSLTAWRRRA
jgi:hypothetical protein